MRIWDNYVYQKGVLCFLIDECYHHHHRRRRRRRHHHHHHHHHHHCYFISHIRIIIILKTNEKE
jgi:hypothetical protein